MIDYFWHIAEDELLKLLASDKNNGLQQDEADKRLKTYGQNTLSTKTTKGTLQLIFAQINSPLIYILLFAATLSLILYAKIDAIIIFSIIIASAALSFFQERGALKSMEKLLKIVQIQTTVLRDGKPCELPLEELVPGDIVLFKAGDVVPADCYLLEARDLYVDEATLTGETFYAEKAPGILPEDSPFSKRKNVLFMGTHVISGSAKALVVLTGKNSEFGKVSDRLNVQPPETEFEHGIRGFGYFLGEITLVLVLIIFGCNVFLGRSVAESMLFAVALSVGLTPQLLPAIISVTLAHGANLMAEKKVIVKRLASIENFGSMNIFCSDKTGTLTTGDIKLDGAFDNAGAASDKVLLFASLNAAFQTGYNNSIDQAILKEAHADIHQWQKLDEVPYDFIRKKLSVLAQKDNTKVMSTKGALKQIIDCCSHVEQSDGTAISIDSVKDEIMKHFSDYSNQGFRVLGLAYKDGNSISQLSPEDEKNMTFLGFLLFWNPLKEHIAETIKDLGALGVQLKIITGDNKLVALYIAKLIGLDNQTLLTGSEIQHMNDQALVYKAQRCSLFVEIEPNQKERIILALRKGGNVVGYMGDGINDVTALHAADVSISVHTAADAAKEVADIVLLEQDLSVLKAGILAGRMTFANTLKYIFMSTSANFGNMFSMAGASLFLSFLPLLPKQVLLTNLLTDFPEMTIATDSVDSEMLEKPLRWNVQFIRRFMLIFGLISSLFDYATFGLLLWLNASVEEFRTGWFVESVVSATLIVLVVRTFKPFYSSIPSKYLLICVIAIVAITISLAFTPLAPYLGFTTLPASYYGFLSIIVVLYIAAVELAKKLFLRNGINSHKKLYAKIASHSKAKPVFRF